MEKKGNWCGWLERLGETRRVSGEWELDGRGERRSRVVGRFEQGWKEWMKREEMKQKDYKCKASEGERVWQNENHVGCGKKKKKKRVKQKREVSEWEKENLIVFLAMEQH